MVRVRGQIGTGSRLWAVVVPNNKREPESVMRCGSTLVDVVDTVGANIQDRTDSILNRATDERIIRFASNDRMLLASHLHGLTNNRNNLIKRHGLGHHVSSPSC